MNEIDKATSGSIVLAGGQHVFDGLDKARRKGCKASQIRPALDL